MDNLCPATLRHFEIAYNVNKNVLGDEIPLWSDKPGPDTH